MLLSLCPCLSSMAACSTILSIAGQKKATGQKKKRNSGQKTTSVFVCVGVCVWVVRTALRRKSWPTLAKTDFGQTDFDLCCVFVCGVSRFHGGFHVWVLVWSCSVPPGLALPRTALPEDRPSLPEDRPSPGTPKISLFFPSPQNSFFSSLSEGLFVEFWWCFPQMCTFGLSGCRVKPRRPENSKRAHFRPRRFKHHQNSTRKPPEREKERK